MAKHFKGSFAETLQWVDAQIKLEHEMAHLEHEERQQVWLVIDETGRVIAICADDCLAQCLARGNASTVEASHEGYYQLGDHLPIFHS